MTSLTYVTTNSERSRAFSEICRNEHFEARLVDTLEQAATQQSDIVFVDAEQMTPAQSASPVLAAIVAACPVVLVSGGGAARDAALALRCGATEVIAYPFDRVETLARLRGLGRLRMLQDELAARQGSRADLGRRAGVLLIGGQDEAGDGLFAALAGSADVVRCSDDPSALIRAADGRPDCIVIAVGPDTRDPALLTRQFREMDRTRQTPIILAWQAGMRASVEAAISDGASDMLPLNCDEALATLRIGASVRRKRVLDALMAPGTAPEQTRSMPGGIDPATGLQGRDFLDRSLNSMLKRLHAQGKPVAFMMIRITVPGESTDAPLPERVMKPIAQLMRRSLRGFDLAVRFGPQDFAILMPGADGDGARIVADRLCGEIAEEKLRGADGGKMTATASIGLAAAKPGDAAHDGAHLIETAEAALETARTAGSSQVFVLAA